ncbi:MAG: metal-sensing transcriptional repressor [Saccharofermentanales bacterium]|jgi:DNA-binding FrmR family transcriptional regulator|nr:metal-sensing transcriptional repressor [Eubacteriales bacterium]
MKAKHEKNLSLLKTARGQIDGLIRMVEDDRYCVDISNQILATIAILKKVNTEVLTEHLQLCVRESFDSDEDKDEKIREIQTIIKKLSS